MMPCTIVLLTDDMDDHLESGRMLGCREDKMAFFEQEDFDLDQFAELHMINLTEKGIGTLKGDLAALQNKCEDDVCIRNAFSLRVWSIACL